MFPMSNRIGSSVGGTEKERFSRVETVKRTEIDVSYEGLLIISSSTLWLEVDGFDAPIVNLRKVTPGYCRIQDLTCSDLRFDAETP